MRGFSALVVLLFNFKSAGAGYNVNLNLILFLIHFTMGGVPSPKSLPPLLPSSSFCDIYEEVAAAALALAVVVEVAAMPSGYARADTRAFLLFQISSYSYVTLLIILNLGGG